MGEIIVTVLKFVITSVFVMAGVVTFIALFTFITSSIFVTINGGAFGDVFAMVAMWSPFHLTIIMAWVIAASTSYIVYRLALVTLQWVNRFLGN